MVPISASQDSPGALGRTVADVAHLYAVLAGTDPVVLDGPAPRFAAATTWKTGHPPTDVLVAGIVDALRRAGESVEDT